MDGGIYRTGEEKYVMIDHDVDDDDLDDEPLQGKTWRKRIPGHKW